MLCAKFGPATSDSARLVAAAFNVSDECSTLKKPHAKPSSAVIARPVNSSSAARPCPITRGSSAQAPMSAPARPTRVNKNAVFAFGVPRRISLANAIIAPAPAQIPSTAAITGCGHVFMALTKSPVMRVKASNSGIVILVSGPMISWTSPPEQKLPPSPEMITALISVA